MTSNSKYMTRIFDGEAIYLNLKRESLAKASAEVKKWVVYRRQRNTEHKRRVLSALKKNGSVNRRGGPFAKASVEARPIDVYR